MVKKGKNSRNLLIAGIAAIAVIIVVALVAFPHGQQNATVNFKWASYSEAQKAQDSNSPTSVELTVYQTSSSGYDPAYWNDGYRSTTPVLDYNPSDGIALVKETRSVNLPAGTASLAIKGTSAYLDPTSIQVKDLAGNALTVLEQNYDYDLVNGNTLLDKYLNKQITVHSVNGTVTGTLISADGPVLMTADGVTMLSSYDRIDFPSLPEGLITTPTISWVLDSATAGPRNLQVSYLTSGIDWSANYVAVDNPEDTQVSLQAWVSLRNNAGVTFNDAKVKLVAGNVNTVTAPTVYPMYAMASSGGAIQNAKSAAVTAQGFSDYHMYTLNQPVTLQSGQVKQVEMASADNVSVQKSYIFDASSSPQVSIRLSFNNTQGSGLGIALPKGNVRVYKADSDGQLEFLGEDSIDNTPQDAGANLTIGDAFDIDGQKTTTDNEVVGSCSSLDSYSITINNHKTEGVTVKVIEHAYGQWEVTTESAPHAKDSATQLSWEVPVAADGTAVVNYTIRTTTC